MEFQSYLICSSLKSFFNSSNIGFTAILCCSP